MCRRLLLSLLALCFVPLAGLAQTPPRPYEPIVGQEGRDVVWVPTPYVTVEKMLDVAKVTPQDFVMDLGSGDGRNIIAAAKRGARALGVEYNPDMVELSRKNAREAGVAEKAQFIQGDMYEADISKATVLALFLLPENLDKLLYKFLALRPGTRIVVNHFWVDGWVADETQRADGECGSWCTVLLFIVPANAAGNWRMSKGEFTLEQKFQTVSGMLSAGGKDAQITDGRLNGDRITFTAGGMIYTGRVMGDAMRGDNGAWSAVRVRSE